MKAFFSGLAGGVASLSLAIAARYKAELLALVLLAAALLPASPINRASIIAETVAAIVCGYKLGASQLFEDLPTL